MAYAPTREEIALERVAIIRTNFESESARLYQRTQTDDPDEINSLLEDSYQAYMIMAIEAKKLTSKEYLNAELDIMFGYDHGNIKVPTFEEYLNML